MSLPSLDLPVLDISYQWSHTLWAFVSGLSSLSIVSRFIHVVVCISASFLLLKIYLSFVYFYSIFCLFIFDCAGPPLLRVGLFSRGERELPSGWAAQASPAAERGLQ